MNPHKGKSGSVLLSVYVEEAWQYANDWLDQWREQYPEDDRSDYELIADEFPAGILKGSHDGRRNGAMPVP